MVLDSDISEEAKNILSNKVSNLNTAPQILVLERFLDLLSLKLSDSERKAWKQRNNAAHGNEFADEGVYNDLVTDTKILKMLLHKIILIITGASEQYFDYSQRGFPLLLLFDKTNI